jgi:signal-transduction protein with cAMP-binding, CBS, and nucleotidyltransferase domain
MKSAEDILNHKNQKTISISEDKTIYEALEIMLKERIGAILVTKAEDIVGIWTERDLMKNTLTKGFDPKTARIGDYMTTNLFSAPHTDSIYNLLDKFLGKRMRHLLIEKDGSYIGLLSTGDVIKANLVDKTNELQELNKIVSWEYYENWRWKGND